MDEAQLECPEVRANGLRYCEQNNVRVLYTQSWSVCDVRGTENCLCLRLAQASEQVNNEEKCSVSLMYPPPCALLCSLWFVCVCRLGKHSHGLQPY